MSKGTASEGPVLRATGLVKSYAAPRSGQTEGEVARKVVVAVPELALAPGETVALMGPSGAGKTTLLHLLAGLLRPDAGRVEIAGTEITALSEAARDRLRAARLGLIFQHFALLEELSATENVVLGQALAGLKPDRPRAEALLAQLGLGQQLRHRPRELSIGQRQRVAVARALVGQPAVVLADEPAAALDPDAARAVLDSLQNLCGQLGAALLLVTHHPAAAALCQRTLRWADLHQPHAIAR